MGRSESQAEEISSSRAALDAATDRCAALEAAAEAAGSSVTEQQRAAAAAQEEVLQARRQLAETEAAASGLEERLLAAESRAAAAEEDLERAAEDLAELIARAESDSGLVAAVQKDLQATVAPLGIALAQLENAKVVAGQAAELAQQGAELTGLLEAAARRAESLEGRLEESEGLRTGLQVRNPPVIGQRRLCYHQFWVLDFSLLTAAAAAACCACSGEGLRAGGKPGLLT